MAGKARGSAAVIILILLLIVAMGAATLGFIGLQKEKQHSAELAEEVAQLEVKKRSAEQEARNLKYQVGDLKRLIDRQQEEIQEFNAKIASANEELSAERKAKEGAISELERFRGELSALRTAKSNLESELKASNDALADLKDKLSALESSKGEAAKEASAQKSAEAADVQLDKIVIASQQSSQPAAPSEGAVQTDAAQPDAAKSGPLEGKVLVVNKEYDFIVISLGKKDNVAMGDAIEILRKDKKIAEAKIEEVRDAMSVAMPLSQGMIKNIKEDDRALRR